MLRVNSLSKSFGKNLVLDNVSKDFARGKIYGLLGRNGAGKTTFLRIISNLIYEYQGEVTYNNKTLKENQEVIDEIILIHNKMIPKNLETERIKSIYKRAGTLLPKWDEEIKDELLKEFNLDDKTKFNKLSEGNKNIVTLILGLASGKNVLLFDEPSTGLDANNRYKFYKILMDKTYAEEKLVVISSHIIDEIEKLLEEVIILEDSKFIVEEEISNLQEKALYISGQDKLVDSFTAKKNIISEKSIGGLKTCGIYDEISNEERDQIISQGCEIKPIPLQDFFVYITERKEK
ncbi:MAG: ABC transporter ATP-binding protein [Tissierellia bacterium]|nr:ABC transporter ATP-binding protein [Tissierellia bacterium]